MAFKEWFRRLQPVQLYLVLFFTLAFFAVEIITSHVTHALTLLVNAYHMLCNIIALIGCIASIKYSNRENCSSENVSDSPIANSTSCVATNGNIGSQSIPSLLPKTKESRSDRRMKNTFGWARINILTMLACCVFLASFCFTLQVEALQTLVHIDHTDAIHQPIVVLCIGAAEIFLNIFCYILIGGYTFYNGSTLRVTANGEVISKRNISADSAATGDKRLSMDKGNGSLRLPGRQGIREMCRDVLGCVFVMIVAVLVQYTDSDVGKFVDPVIAIVSSASLFILSYPYMKESGLILLQTIPNHINIDSLKKELLEAFPGIVNVHDLHVWQLTGEKIICTAHIIFLDPAVYESIRDEVTAFFVELGITQVTVQPEFHKITPNIEKIDCLIRCRVENCIQSRCCSKDTSLDDPAEAVTRSNCKSNSHGTASKQFEKKEIIPAPPSMDSKSFTLPATAVSVCELDLESGENNIDEISTVENRNNSRSRETVVDIDDTTEISTNSMTSEDQEVTMNTAEEKDCVKKQETV